MRNLGLLLFFGINTAFASIDSCTYGSPPECSPLTRVVLGNGKSVNLVKKWVQGPKKNKFAASFCSRQVKTGFYTCRKPDCSSTPCLHGSTCIETRSSYRCNCALGFYGPQCQHASLTIPTTTVITTTSTTTLLTTSSSTSSPISSQIVTSTPTAPHWTSHTGSDTVTMVTTASSLLTASSSTGSTSSPMSSPIVTSTPTAPQWTSYTESDTETMVTTSHDVTTDDVTSDDVTTNDPTVATTSQASQTSTTARPFKSYGWIGSITHRTFEEANQTCIAFEPSSPDSGLIEITDEVEKAYITNFANVTLIPQNESLWIGCPKYLSGDPEHGFYCYHSDYRYSSRENINIGYWDWDTDEPLLSGRRCMVLNLSTQKYRAEYCDAVAIALCEFTPT